MGSLAVVMPPHEGTRSGAATVGGAATEGESAVATAPREDVSLAGRTRVIAVASVGEVVHAADEATCSGIESPLRFMHGP